MILELPLISPAHISGEQNTHIKPQTLMRIPERLRIIAPPLAPPRRATHHAHGLPGR